MVGYAARVLVSKVCLKGFVLRFGFLKRRVPATDSRLAY
jgi:hypothetical protein